MIYKVRRIRKNWAGIGLFDLCGEHIGPGVDDVTGLPITGLTENTWEKGNNGSKKEVKGTREQLEIDLGMEKGTLAPGSIYKPNPFWLNFSVRIGEDDLELDESIADHRLKLLFLKAQPQFAVGIGNQKSKSEFVIFTETEEASASNTVKSKRRQAYVAFEKLSKQDKSDVLKATGTNPEGLTIDIIEDKLSDWMELNPEKFMAIVEDPDRAKKVLFRQWMDMAIITMEGDQFAYKDTMLGFTLDIACAEIHKPENSEMLTAIKAMANEQGK